MREWKKDENDTFGKSKSIFGSFQLLFSPFKKSKLYNNRGENQRKSNNGLILSLFSAFSSQRLNCGQLSQLGMSVKSVVFP